MDYFKYWNNYYKGLSDKNEQIGDLKSVIQDLQKQGYLSYNVTIDGTYNKEMLIYEHIDPIEGKKDDMRAICLDNDVIHWGNIISLEDGRVYMSITQADWNEAYNKYRITQLEDDMTFGNNLSIKCTVANKGFYNESSFTNETNVFEDKELRAALIQYNQDTKNLRLFDNVYINNNHYKIVKIDNHTLKEHDKEFGVLQLVVIDTPFGTIKKNDIEELRGTLMGERVKDKVLNSVSRGLLCEHDKVSRGDYITFEYDRDNQGTMVKETYLVFNKPTMEGGYDRSLTYLCESTMNLLDGEGNVVNVPLYFENNRTRIDKTTDNQFIKLRNSSYMFIAQYNETTKRLVDKVNRVIIDGFAYEVTGIDPFSKGLIAFGLETSQINPNDDSLELGVANYYSQMEEIENSSPPIPIENIVGRDSLYIDYENEYEFKSSGVPVWSVDNDNVKLVDIGNNKCTLLCTSTKELNKKITLIANVNGIGYTKKILIEMI